MLLCIALTALEKEGPATPAGDTAAGLATAAGPPDVCPLALSGGSADRADLGAPDAEEEDEEEDRVFLLRGRDEPMAVVAGVCGALERRDPEADDEDDGLEGSNANGSEEGGAVPLVVGAEAEATMAAPAAAGVEVAVREVVRGWELVWEIEGRLAGLGIGFECGRGG